MKISGARNMGWGKSMRWAFKNAINTAYGDGRYSTRAELSKRCAAFSHWLLQRGITDLSQVDIDVITGYATHLGGRVASGEIQPTYAHNMLSAVNRGIRAVRGRQDVWLSPADFFPMRSSTRFSAPSGIDNEAVKAVCDALSTQGEVRVALIIGLVRNLGLRLREACLLDTRRALAQATKCYAVNIARGTKGGRGKNVERWVPADERVIEILERASTVQGHRDNLVPDGWSVRQFADRVRRVARPELERAGLTTIRDLRSAYACDVYQRITRDLAPCVAAGRSAPKEDDRSARAEIAKRLGHSRPRSASAYVGSAR